MSEIDLDEALAWRDSVERTVREAAGDTADDLLDSVRFLESLDALVDMDPDDPDFADEVREAVVAWVGTDEPTQDRYDGGRILESRGTGNDGGRVFHVQIIKAGKSRNQRRYPAQVLREAAPLYEGAKAYDRHRTPAELQSSTIVGLVGAYRNVEARDDGLYAELHLLPSAHHTAEALDASLAAQARGHKPLVGISHDAMTVLRPVMEGGKRIQEAVRITRVNSADVVADPSAGGKATRVLAGGYDESDMDESEEEDVAVTSESLVAALTAATPEQLASVQAALSRVTESAEPSRETGAVDSTESVLKNGFMGKMMVERLVEAAKLPASVAASLLVQLPERITESDVASSIASIKAVLGVAERAELEPTYKVEVTKEALDKKLAHLDGMFDHTGRTPGYKSLRAAWADITGARVRAWDSDINLRIMRETASMAYDSHGRVGAEAEMRSTEALDTSSWPQVLGDSITRRAVALYGTPSLQSWRKVVSSMPAVNDFREQKRERIGGYGLLPTVNQGAPYQALTSPTDEEAAYTVIKRGGTETLTWETIVNDDLGKVQQIPRSLGLAAAITIYRYVWDIFVDNAATSYDAVALFHTATHANYATSTALNQANLSAARASMRSQAAYNHSTNILSLVPQLLVVPNELEELAFQLTTSAVAIPSTPAGPSDTPNIHRGLDVEVIDYWTDANNWFLFADPLMCPLIELGFLFGRQEPEIFTQQDQTVGSMFDADKVTYKIRHIYAGTPLDHRGMARYEG